MKIPSDHQTSPDHATHEFFRDTPSTPLLNLLGVRDPFENMSYGEYEAPLFSHKFGILPYHELEPFFSQIANKVLEGTLYTAYSDVPSTNPSTHAGAPAALSYDMLRETAEAIHRQVLLEQLALYVLHNIERSLTDDTAPEVSEICATAQTLRDVSWFGSGRSPASFGFSRLDEISTK